MKRNPFVSIQQVDGIYNPAEDTMLLLDEIAVGSGQKVLEVGTGSGFLAMHCALAGADVVATDFDLAAIKAARRNAEVSGAEIHFVWCNLASAVKGPFDLILFNPPYLPGNSGIKSVDGGKDGIEPAIGLMRDVARLIGPSGKLLLVLSSLSNSARLAKIFPGFRFSPVRRRRYFFEELVVWEVRPTKK